MCRPSPGVYVVVRRHEPPSFLDVSPAGHFKGKDPTVPVAELAALWVPGTRIVYIGNANLGSDGKRHLQSLGGAGCHGGPGITFIPGYNAGYHVLDDLG